MRLILALLALACPLFGQIVATCPASGNVATITWSADPAHPGASEVRIERNDDGAVRDGGNPRGIKDAKELAVATGNGTATSSTRTATFATRPGPYDTYTVQENPYWQSKAVPFVCAGGQTIAGQGVTVTLDGTTIGTIAGNVAVTIAFTSQPGMNVLMTPSLDGKTVLVQVVVEKPVP